MAISPPRPVISESWARAVAAAAPLGGDVADVAVDRSGAIHLLTRHPSGVIVFDAGGRLVRSYGQGELSARPHGITIGLDGLVYCVDEDDHAVRKFTAEGRPAGVIGVPGHASDTGADWSIADFRTRVGSIRHGGPPFNHPTKLAVAPSGDLYVADGYANARVHRFSAGGELLQSWGEPGTGRGEFHVPHCVVVTPDERLLVADRENDRVQVFSLDGRFLDAWTDLRRPSAVAVSSEGFVYVTEMACPAGHESFVHGRVEQTIPARVSVLDGRGRPVHRFAHGGHPCDAGNVLCPHGVAVGADGSLYVAEITRTALASGSGGIGPGEVGARHCHVVHRFVPGAA